MHLSNTINLVKPTSTLAESSFSDSPISACYNTDAIIACANEKSVIKKDYLKSMKPKGLIIDLGKGNLDKQSVIYAKNRKIKIKPLIFPFNKMQNLLKNSSKSKKPILIFN